ncbi:MAG: peptidoglycan editing factor PgeF [Deltaproteobacteria bacterium]|nr:peptidoglycan editing factor PgeF [Deltaproteobacteria bacterium]
MSRVIQSELLNSFSFIQHGFLTRDFGKDQTKGIPVRQFCRIKQVHGNDVVVAQNEKKLEMYKQTSADSVLTQLPQIALIISTADCVPLLFCDPSDEGKKVIAAAHAGWRGTAKNVAQTTVQMLQKKFHCEPKNIVVAIGPAIQECCYEVDRNVYDQISQKDFFKPIAHKENHWMLSLPQLNGHQLMKAGVSKEHIWISPLCTACHLDQFYSYRKEGESAGRQWSFIALR